MATADSTERAAFAARVDQNLIHLKWSVQRAAADAQAAGSRAGAGLQKRPGGRRGGSPPPRDRSGSRPDEGRAGRQDG